MLTSSFSSLAFGIKSQALSRRKSTAGWQRTSRQSARGIAVVAASTTQLVSSKQPRLMNYAIITGLLIAVLLVQCVQSYELLYRADHSTVCVCNQTVHATCPDDFCTEKSGAGKVLRYSKAPCFCEGFTAKNCPGECKKNPSLNKDKSERKQTKEGGKDGVCICHGKLELSCPKECIKNQDSEPIDYFDSMASRHDDAHPDHIDSQMPVPDLTRVDSTLRRHGYQGGHIERHMKVYVAPKTMKAITIAPIKMIIPMKIPENQIGALPTAKPIYTYKKYVSYETKPEIQMVPVTKTIIRPAGVSLDQIIDEDGNQVPRDFDVKKL